MNNPSDDIAARAVVQPAPLRVPGVDDRCHCNVVHLEAVQTARGALPAPDQVTRLVDLLALVANATRLKILLALLPRGDRRPELCVCDLAVVCGASQSLISHQLRLLRTAGLVAQRRDGKLAYYRLTCGATGSLLHSALAFAAWPEPPG